MSASTHVHLFDDGNAAGERGTRVVAWITALTMVVEIAAGGWFNSMALLADGFHMSTHAVAIGLSAFAYAAARRHAKDGRFAFGTWKIEVLGGYSSALFLLVVALLMVAASVERLFSPAPIHYREAIVVAVLGLAVNIVCAWLLGAAHHHGDEHDHEHAHAPVHDHDHGHAHHHDDLNLRAAYLHVLADAATSVLAIVALAAGLWLGWSWLDPVMGVVGALLIVVWARRLIVDTGTVLLDREMDHPVVGRVRKRLAEGLAGSATRVDDLHVWRVGKRSYACALSLGAARPGLTPEAVRGWLGTCPEIVHSTIEIDHTQPAI